MRGIHFTRLTVTGRRGVVGLDVLREVALLSFLVGGLFWGLMQAPLLRSTLVPAEADDFEWPIHGIYLDAAERDVWIVREGHGLSRRSLTDGLTEELLPSRFPLCGAAAYSDRNDSLLAILRYDDIIEIWRNSRVVADYELDDPQDNLSDVAIADRGRMVVAVTTCGRVFVWRRDGEDFALAQFEVSMPVNRISLSRDARFAACVIHQNQIVVLDLCEQRVIASWDTPHTCCTELEWSPDGRSLATVGFGGQLCLWDAAAGTLQWSVIADVCNPSHAAFAPDGARVITGGFGCLVRVWDAATGTLQNEFAGHRRGVRTLVCASDGGRVYSGGLDGEVKCWNLAPRGGEASF